MSTITNISNELWDDITDILPNEKPKYTVGRPIIPFRKVMDGILYVLRTQMPMEDAFQKIMVLVLLAIEDSSNGLG